MKKNGFTLIELVGVIALLGLITAIAVPNILSAVKRSEEQNHKEYLDTLYSATELYVEKNKQDYQSLNNINAIEYIELTRLVDQGYLLANIKNPKPIVGDGAITTEDVIKVEILETYLKKYNLEKKKTLIETVIGTYSLTNNEQIFTAPESGYYKLETWGASGGNVRGFLGGKGAYTSGEIYLVKDEQLYIQVGEAGEGAEKANDGGYNGGEHLVATSHLYGSSGGGSTDIRIVSGTWDNFESLKSRIMVSAGGGGSANRNNLPPENKKYGEGHGGSGGALEGFAGTNSNSNGISNYQGYHLGFGATQIKGGATKSYTYDSMQTNEEFYSGFGKGKQILTYTTAGGGYYTGGYAGHAGAGGGSSYISGHAGVNSIDKSSTENNIIHLGTIYHYSNKSFKNTKMIDGNSEMPTHDGTATMTGNTGDGYAKITLQKY